MQFAVSPDDGRDDRRGDESASVSRSSALASKATGFPYRQDRGQARRRATRSTRSATTSPARRPRASSRPSTTWSPRCPRFAFEKFPTTADSRLSTQMKSVGEVMAHRSDLQGEPAEGDPVARNRSLRLRDARRSEGRVRRGGDRSEIWSSHRRTRARVVCGPLPDDACGVASASRSSTPAARASIRWFLRNIKPDRRTPRPRAPGRGKTRRDRPELAATCEAARASRTDVSPNSGRSRRRRFARCGWSTA